MSFPIASLGAGRDTLLACTRLCPCAGIPFETPDELEAWLVETCRDFEVSRADALAVAGEVYGFDFDPPAA